MIENFIIKTKEELSFLDSIYNSHKNDNKNFVVIEYTYKEDKLEFQYNKTFDKFDDAKKHADYLSKYFIKFSDGYYNYRDAHHFNNIPRILTNVIITVIYKNNVDYYTKYLVTEFNTIDT